MSVWWGVSENGSGDCEDLEMETIAVFTDKLLVDINQTYRLLAFWQGWEPRICKVIYDEDKDKYYLVSYSTYDDRPVADETTCSLVGAMWCQTILADRMITLKNWLNDTLQKTIMS